MSNRPTIQDLAREAGVSVATVDRVLNRRASVRAETATRVYEAARTLGYHATAVIKQRMSAELPVLRFGFLLQTSRHPFYQSFAQALQQSVENCQSVRGTLRIEHVDDGSVDTVLGKLDELGKSTDVLALVSPDNHHITERVRKLREQGKPVFSLLSDFAQGVREHYIGLNNLKVGRTAAWLISRTAPRPGKIALFVGSFRWHGHELRETGFRSYFREFAPQFELLETMVNLDTRGVTEEAARALLQRHSDLVGVYVAGGGMEGAIAALREARPDPLPAMVVNELTPDSSAALQDHLIVGVISTPLTRLSESLIELMISSRLNGSSDTPGQLFLPFDLQVPESI